jgi:hypothetical protein
VDVPRRKKLGRFLIGGSADVVGDGLPTGKPVLAGDYLLSVAKGELLSRRGG